MRVKLTIQIIVMIAVIITVFGLMSCEVKIIPESQTSSITYFQPIVIDGMVYNIPITLETSPTTTSSERK